MKVFTDAQVLEIEYLLLEVERSSKARTIAYAEKIRAILHQAEPVAVEFNR